MLKTLLHCKGSQIVYSAITRVKDGSYDEYGGDADDGPDGA